MAAGDFALTTPQMRQAAHLYQTEHWSARQIADHFGVSKNAVQNALSYMGVQPRSALHGRLLRLAHRAVEA